MAAWMFFLVLMYIMHPWRVPSRSLRRPAFSGSFSSQFRHSLNSSRPAILVQSAGSSLALRSVSGEGRYLSSLRLAASLLTETANKRYPFW
jgi:hypothetical protein